MFKYQKIFNSYEFINFTKQREAPEKKISPTVTQGGTKCQLVENIIETCNSMWYFCAANQYEVIERKAIYVKVFIILIVSLTLHLDHKLNKREFCMFIYKRLS